MQWGKQDWPQKRKLRNFFSLISPPHVLLQYLPPFLHTYQLCHLFPAEATYAVLLCRDKRLAFDKVAIDSKVKPISINTEKLKPPKNKRNQIFVGMLIKFRLSEKHTKFEKIFLVVLKNQSQNNEEDFFKLCVLLKKSEL